MDKWKVLSALIGGFYAFVSDAGSVIQSLFGSGFDPVLMTADLAVAVERLPQHDGVAVLVADSK